MKRTTSRFQRIKAAFSRTVRKAKTLLGNRNAVQEEKPSVRDYGFAASLDEQDSYTNIGTAKDSGSSDGDGGSGDDGGMPKYRVREADDERDPNTHDAQDERNDSSKPKYKDYAIPPNLTKEQQEAWEERQERKERERREREKLRKANAKKAAREREARRIRRLRAASERANQQHTDDGITEPREPRDEHDGGELQVG